MMPLTPFQRGAYAALTISAPAVGRLYRAICETPGLSMSQLRAETDMVHINHWVSRLEHAGLIASRLKRVQGRMCRLYFPAPEAEQ